MAKMIILIDTREQKPFIFPKGITTWKTGLTTGDYSVKGGEGRNGICIERKSINDLFVTYTSNRERFNEELARMKELSFKAVIVEASYSRVCKGIEWCFAQGDLIASYFVADCMKNNVAPIFCQTRIDARIMTQLYLTIWHNENMCDTQTGKETKATTLRKSLKKTFKKKR